MLRIPAFREVADRELSINSARAKAKESEEKQPCHSLVLQRQHSQGTRTLTGVSPEQLEHIPYTDRSSALSEPSVLHNILLLKNPTIPLKVLWCTHFVTCFITASLIPLLVARTHCWKN